MRVENPQNGLAEALVRKIDFDPFQIAAALGSRPEKLTPEQLENLILEEGEEVWGIFLYNEVTHVCGELVLFPERRLVYFSTRVPTEALQISVKREGTEVKIIPHINKPTTEVSVDLDFLGLDQVAEVYFYPFSRQVEFRSSRQGSISTLKVGPDCRHVMTTYSSPVCYNSRDG